MSLADASMRVEGLVIDALAYADEVSEAERAHADALVEAELGALAAERGFPPRHAPGEHEALAAHYLRGTALEAQIAAAARQPASPLVQEAMARLAAAAAAPHSAAAAAAASTNVIDAQRHAFPAAPAAPGAAADPLAWEAAVARAETSVEAQAFRAANVELALQYGVESWRAAAGEADAAAAAAAARAAALQARIDSVNAARGAAQTGGAGAGAGSGVGAGAGQAAPGARLRMLGRKAAQIAETNFETEVACAEAEQELKRLRREEAAELAAAAAAR